MSAPKIHTLAILFSALLMVSPSVAAPSGCQDIWRVDLHAVARLNANEQHFSKLQYYRWQNNHWNRSDAETFFGTQKAEIPCIIFAPGYTSTTPQTTQVGLGVVRNFDPLKPCRVVFWDWYSDRAVCGVRRDVRGKIPVAKIAADYLAFFVQSLKSQSKVCLFGFSFGSRIACNAAETMLKENRQPEGLRLHLVLSGAATDDDWFAEGHRHGGVPKIAEKILITYNPSDWALQFYSFMYDLRHRAAALGLEGPPMNRISPEYRDRFEAVDVSPYIDSGHKTLLHVQTPVFRKRINSYFFFE